MTSFTTMTREAALERLAAVIPHVGRAYASGRNTDVGPDREPTTTALSPFLRRRLLLEEEVVSAALDEHGPEAAGKFIEEVFWRSYFKGHLETRPAIWTRYAALVAEGKDRIASQSGLRRVYESGVAGSTGIDGFDDWARELSETGWLHNHARMWFASIWIFTLRLPWALGADFFLRHLVDGDPASNTLSWRWVAGLHTRGKVYAARADNIRRYTDGRFSPQGLNESPEAIEEGDPPELKPLPRPDPIPNGEIALLLHLDDLYPESLPLGEAKVVRIGCLLAHPPDAVVHVRRADEQAMADALERAKAYFGCDAGPATEGWAGDLPIVTPWAPVGPSASALPSDSSRIRRRWDDLTWPRATRGYFQVKTAIPSILRDRLVR
ncbi:FAD-binding domain-containing protein [Lichenifustis flavocetrariae]|uniref:Deoxyribodipyrimidine photolyase n=1 Tax=Lichenifustis flavocetrariae TaxID=2949735 RepID=A0AA41Z0R2_9HYPH|nr:FAD-binding domain-containing protein [Lichenifustis flavocetrariae]MCW6512066.1 deoxyribodipyrimidine photolyase [Lichenifustis flavocetrariae]